jgi:hypothetical protein
MAEDRAVYVRFSRQLGGTRCTVRRGYNNDPLIMLYWNRELLRAEERELQGAILDGLRMQDAEGRLESGGA